MSNSSRKFVGWMVGFLILGTIALGLAGASWLRLSVIERPLNNLTYIKDTSNFRFYANTTHPGAPTISGLWYCVRFGVITEDEYEFIYEQMRGLEDEVTEVQNKIRTANPAETDRLSQLRYDLVINEVIHENDPSDTRKIEIEKLQRDMAAVQLKIAESSPVETKRLAELYNELNTIQDYLRTRCDLTRRSLETEKVTLQRIAISSAAIGGLLMIAGLRFVLVIAVAMVRRSTQMTNTRSLMYLIDRLRVTAEAIYREESIEHSLGRCVLLFTANGLEAASEVAETLDAPMAGWLVLRTLWQNTACLAFLLFDERGHDVIAEILDADNDLRAITSLVDEPMQLLGEEDANQVFRDAAFDPDAIREAAEKAREMKNPWKNIRTDELRTSLDRMCNGWKDRDEEAWKSVTTLVKQVEVAVTRGNNIAHPNLLGIQTLLQVVDLEKGKILLSCDAPGNERDLRVILASQLLLLHAAALALRFPDAIDFHEVWQASGELLSDDDAK